MHINDVRRKNLHANMKMFYIVCFVALSYVSCPTVALFVLCRWHVAVECGDVTNSAQATFFTTGTHETALDYFLDHSRTAERGSIFGFNQGKLYKWQVFYKCLFFLNINLFVKCYPFVVVLMEIKI